MCATCGISGKYFAKERQRVGPFPQNGQWHFNLYAIKEKWGREVMMTVDHIIPICLGGISEQSNYQPMCQTCNQKKGAEEDPHINDPNHRSRIKRLEVEANKSKDEIALERFKRRWANKIKEATKKATMNYHNREEELK